MADIEQLHIRRVRAEAELQKILDEISIAEAQEAPAALEEPVLGDGGAPARPQSDEPVEEPTGGAAVLSRPLTHRERCRLAVVKVIGEAASEEERRTVEYCTLPVELLEAGREAVAHVEETATRSVTPWFEEMRRALALYPKGLSDVD